MGGNSSTDRFSNRKDSRKRKQEVALRERRRWRCMWLSEGRLAACAAFLYISRRSVLVYDPPPIPVPQRLTCTAASAVSLALRPLCSAMGSAGQTSEGGSEGGPHWIPLVPFLCFHSKLEGRSVLLRWPSPCDCLCGLWHAPCIGVSRAPTY